MDKKIKHLEMIQGVINRMASNSFLLKGWTVVLVSALFALAANDKIDMGWWLEPCGFKQRFGLPCPTCGMTTALFVFCKGRVIEAFYIQPAGALFYCILVVAAFLSLFTAVFGVYFRILGLFLRKIKVLYVILVLLLIVICGWAVTLARALSEGGE